MVGYLLVAIVSATVGMAVGVTIFEATWAVAGLSYLVGGWLGIIGLATASVMNGSKQERTAMRQSDLEEWLAEYDPDDLTAEDIDDSWIATLPHKRVG